MQPFYLNNQQPQELVLENKKERSNINGNNNSIASSGSIEDHDIPRDLIE
jgi:hypothetical protein